MEQVNYEKLLPNKPPEGLIQWMKDNGRFDKNYIVYKHAYRYNPLTGLNEKMVQCTCSACKETFYLPRAESICCHVGYSLAPFGFVNVINGNSENVISGDTTICPLCGDGVEAIHIGQLRRDILINEYIPMSIHRVKNRLALITWYICRKLSPAGETSIYCKPFEAYVVEDRKIVKLVGYTRVMSNISWYCSWVQRTRFSDTYGNVSVKGIYPFDAGILVGTSAENCKLDKYINDCKDENVYPVSYMNLWVKHKNVENLVMQSASLIINEKIGSLRLYEGYAGSINNIQGINWKAKRPNEMLGLSKEDFRNAIKFKWTAGDIEFYNEVKDRGIKPNDIYLCKKHDYYWVKQLLNYNGVNIMRTLRYVEKQAKKYPKQRKVIISDIVDYWGMMKKLKEDITDERIRYPQNLIRAHDVAMSRIEYKKSQEKQEQFIKRTSELEKYIYESNGYIIRPAASHIELVNEGKALNHCVARYSNKHAKGDTAIFFIRRAETPEVSYFTLEFDEKNLIVRQNRGLNNCSRTDEIRRFEDEWLKHIKALGKERKKNGKRNSKNAA